MNDPLISKMDELPPNAGVMQGIDLNINDISIPKHIVLLRDMDYVLKPSIFIVSNNFSLHTYIFQNFISAMKAHEIEIQQMLLVSTDIFNILNNQSRYLASINENGTAFEVQEQLDTFIIEALNNRCSDLHFQLNKDSASLFHRIDGQLVHIRDLEPTVINNFLETVYVSFSVNQEHESFQFNTPQFSAYESKYFLKKPYIKTSKQFIPHEVTVRLRKQRCPLDKDTLDEVWRIIIIDYESEPPTLRDLGYEPIQIELMERAIHRPEGLILVTGTTGSGKTVTLSTMLQLSATLNQGSHCIRTIENPKELVLPFARQRSIASADDFAISVEIYLRMDPDEMMIGEIRDTETATAVTRGVLSGHPVYGTLHTSDVATVIARLEGLGVDNVTMGEKNFLNIICNQSLIRLLCNNCKLPFKQSAEATDAFLATELMYAGTNTSGIFGPSATGCAHCSDTGFSGRTVIAEVVEISQKMKRMLYLGKIYEAFDHWLQQDYCRHKGNPKSKLEHALIRLERGEVSPKSIIDSCGILY